MLKKVLLVVLFLVAVDVLIFGTSGSHPVPKSHAAEFEIGTLQAYADSFKEQLLRVPHLDNATFVSITKLDGKVRRYSDKGEVLDPWGQPHVISRNGDQITITSPGLDQYNKLSPFQKWWSNE
jgi:hypothetical protein